MKKYKDGIWVDETDEDKVEIKNLDLIIGIGIAIIIGIIIAIA